MYIASGFFDQANSYLKKILTQSPTLQLPAHRHKVDHLPQWWTSVHDNTIVPRSPRKANKKLAPIEVHVGCVVQGHQARNRKPLRRCVRNSVGQSNGAKEFRTAQHNVIGSIAWIRVLGARPDCHILGKLQNLIGPPVAQLAALTIGHDA